MNTFVFDKIAFIYLLAYYIFLRGIKELIGTLEILSSFSLKEFTSYFMFINFIEKRYVLNFKITHRNSSL